MDGKPFRNHALGWLVGLVFLGRTDICLAVLYFGVLVILYTLNIVTFIFAPPTAKGSLASLTNTVSSTLVARMMLNIRLKSHGKGHLSSLADFDLAEDGPALKEQHNGDVC